MPLMNSYIDLSFNREWKVVNMESNLQLMFDKLQDRYFTKWLKNVKYLVTWDTTGIISDDSCFKIFDDHKEVLIKDTAMTQPRVVLVSVLMHILIHIYLATASKGTIKINTHDDNFRSIMLYLNETVHLKISVRNKLKSPY